MRPNLSAGSDSSTSIRLVEIVVLWHGYVLGLAHSWSFTWFIQSFFKVPSPSALADYKKKYLDKTLLILGNKNYHTTKCSPHNKDKTTENAEQMEVPGIQMTKWLYWPSWAPRTTTISSLCRKFMVGNLSVYMCLMCQ